MQGEAFDNGDVNVMRHKRHLVQRRRVRIPLFVKASMLPFGTP